MIVVRVMTIKDYDDVYELWMNTKGMGMRNLDDSRSGIAKFLERNPTTNFIASDGNKIVGVILAGNDGRRAYICHTTVRSDYRGQGIATQLVKECLSAVKAEGINKTALVVFADNQLGNDFWQSQGFKEREDLTYRDFSLNEENI